MPYFDLDKLKVGDRLWDFCYGPGIVEKIYEDLDRPIRVVFDTIGISTYDLDGKKLKKYNQTLFYSEIQFTPPPRPKRVVKRKEVFTSVCFRGGSYHPELITANPNEKIFAGILYNNPPMTMTLEWDEEE